jgi:membrane-bound lytic murein transglycosylase B
MNRSLLKKIIIGGAIILSAASALGEQKQVQLMRKPEEKILSIQRDPFVPPKNLQYVLRQEAKIVKSLEELTRRLEKDRFDKKQVQAAYEDKRFIVHRNIINLFDKSPETKGAKGIITYDQYRKSLGLEDKLLRAPDFMKKYKEELATAEKKYGVDKRYVVAILGIESDFGSNGGHYYAFNALTSMYATRLKEFAYKELKEYLIICNKRKKDVYSYKASYAGAFTKAQFMPSSFNKLFVSKDGESDGDPDSMEDCIHSICNYLKANGWNAKANERVPNPDSLNWRAIFSYNRSPFYVKAVIELATKARWNANDLKAVAASAGYF